ncbi:MAG: carboxymuconolactone decarboxylase family protein [Candidatus Dadabacteria bacterium]
MKNRISIKELEPEAYKAMLTVEEYTKHTDVSPILKELIKMRASQINGCAFCLDMHTEDAISLGETPRRIFLLAAWKECHLFTEEEKAVLQLTEEMTLISKKGVTDETYEKVISLFGEKRTAQMMMLIVQINSWNRISVSTRAIYKP